MIRLWLALTLAKLLQALPSVFLPINAQVPPVARAGQYFEFQFAQTTFTSAVGPISYAISNGPAWLELHGDNKTFSGTPTSSDTRSPVIDLVATDGSGATTMAVTFVISTNTGPGLGRPVSEQLSVHTGFSAPDSLLVPHSTDLSLSFSSDTFTNINGNTSYYALCANSTPLPSWLKFDPKGLSFLGVAPPATSFTELPITYEIEMTASDVIGFAGAIATFSIVVESHLFAFDSSLQVINATVGRPINNIGLLNSLALSSRPVNSSTISVASAAAPPWLSLDPKTFILSGTPPEGAVSQKFSVNVTDVYGDTASTAIWIQMSSQNSATVLLSPVPTLMANNGSNFVYDLSRTLTNKNATIDVRLGAASSWLTFDLVTLELRGQPPSDSMLETYVVNVTASLGPQSQSQILIIHVEPSQTSAGATGRVENSTGSPTGIFAGGPTGSPTGAHSNGDTSSAAITSNGGLLHDSRWIALPVVLPIAVLFTSLIIYCYCRRRRRHKLKYRCEYSNKSSEDQTSFPVHQEKNSAAKEAPMMSGALHSNSGGVLTRISRPPIIDMPGIWKSYTNKRKSEIHTSQVNAGVGDRASGADSWHRYTMNFNVRPQSTAVEGTGATRTVESAQKRELTSRHRLKSDFPRFSVSSQSSPTHRYSRSRQAQSNMSFGSSVAFSSRMNSFGLGHGRSIRSQNSSGARMGTRGIGHGDGRGPPGYGTVRDSWRNFRLMHVRSIDGTSSSESEVVGCIVPPLQATKSNSPDKRSIKRVLSISHPSGKSHHLHRRSTVQTFTPIESTTTTYRRHKQNPTSDPLQEFHRRRLLLKNTSRALFSAGPSESSRKPSHYASSLPRTPSRTRVGHRSSISILPTTPEHDTHNRRDRSHSHSRSSSLSTIPPLHYNLPKSSRASPERSSHLRHNTYSATTGIRLPLISQGGSRKSSIMSDDEDSRWESASSDAQSMDPYIYSREINNGHRETSLFDTQQKQAGKGQGDFGSIRGMERFARGLKGQSWQRAQFGGSHTDDEERGRGRPRVRLGGEEKGKMAAVAKAEPGNVSFRGDISGLDDDDDGTSAFV